MPRRVLVAAAIVVLVIAGCDPAVTTPEEAGAVRVRIIDTVSSRTFTPALDMSIVSYSVSGTGPHDLVYESGIHGVEQSELTIENLWVGQWDFTVTGYNAGESPVAIGEGSGSVIVEANSTKEVEVTIRQYAGDGTLELTISLPAIPGLTVQGTLNPPSGSELSPVELTGFLIDEELHTATYSNSGIPAGFYTMSITLIDEGPLLSQVHAVRIISGMTTIGELSFDSESLNSTVFLVVGIDVPAELNVQITDEGGEWPGTLPANSAMYVYAEPDTESGTYYWYVNGALVPEASDSSLNISGPDAEAQYSFPEPGFYTITVVVEVGQVLGSASRDIEITSVEL